MIRVDVKKYNNYYYGLRISGHAYSDDYGKDLVCAAVSTLAQTVANAIEKVGNVPENDFKVTIKNGLLEFVIKEAYRSDVTNIVFETFLVGIRGIEDTYSEYVKLRIKEVQGDV